jgi:hypothetical protein
MAICKRCINTHCEPFPWTPSDTEVWRKGYIVCWMNDRLTTDHWEKVGTKEPPKGCKFYLEHLVMCPRNVRNVLQSKPVQAHALSVAG